MITFTLKFKYISELETLQRFIQYRLPHLAHLEQAVLFQIIQKVESRWKIFQKPTSPFGGTKKIIRLKITIAEAIALKTASKIHMPPPDDIAMRETIEFQISPKLLHV